MTLSNDRMMIFHIPDDPKILEALGTVSVRHGQLDHILKMTVKTLGDLTIAEARDATAFESSSSLRERIRKLARQRLGEGTALLKLQALLTRCGRATKRRNDYVHGTWAREIDGVPLMITEDGQTLPPTIEQLDALAAELLQVTGELNNARLEGFLSEALAARSS